MVLDSRTLDPGACKAGWDGGGALQAASGELDSWESAQGASLLCGAFCLSSRLCSDSDSPAAAAANQVLGLQAYITRPSSSFDLLEKEYKEEKAEICRDGHRSGRKKGVEILRDRAQIRYDGWDL